MQLNLPKQQLKMQRLSGHLQDVVVYKNQTTKGIFREEVQAHLLYGRLFYCMQCLSYDICSSMLLQNSHIRMF